MKKEIFIIRHGETDFNTKGIVQGKGIDASLNKQGKKQALLFFENYREEGFEKIYVSTLRRTHETVLPFLSLEIPVEQHAALDEISWGIHEGKSNGETFRQFDEITGLWRKGKVHVKIEQGESPVDVQQRLQTFLKEILAKKENKILVCSHGRAMRILLCTLLDKPLSDMDTFPHHNVCLYKLIFENNVFTIELFNDREHLDER